MKELFAGLTAVLLATTLVLPGRQTPAIVDKGLGGASKLAKSVIGQG